MNNDSDNAEQKHIHSLIVVEPRDSRIYKLYAFLLKGNWISDLIQR